MSFEIIVAKFQHNTVFLFKDFNKFRDVLSKVPPSRLWDIVVCLWIIQKEGLAFRWILKSCAMFASSISAIGGKVWISRPLLPLLHPHHLYAWKHCVRTDFLFGKLYSFRKLKLKLNAETSIAQTSYCTYGVSIDFWDVTKTLTPIIYRLIDAALI